jgi:hypothetical protein
VLTVIARSACDGAIQLSLQRDCFVEPHRARIRATFGRVRQNNPTGKISLNPSGKSALSTRPSHPTRGAVRDRHGRWCGMRWTWIAPLTNGADADGEVVWS